MDELRIGTIFITDLALLYMESKSGLDVFLFMNGRDKLMDGKGEVKIQILGLLNVVDDKDNPKINTGSAIRSISCLIEIKNVYFILLIIC
ncbi:MAG: hypothetical protein IPI90_03400 [Saprospiraceae bacterium]|nr:hypothetical protein [Candidatus Vicinibacter affinis]